MLAWRLGTAVEEIYIHWIHVHARLGSVFQEFKLLALRAAPQTMPGTAMIWNERRKSVGSPCWTDHCPGNRIWNQSDKNDNSPSHTRNPTLEKRVCFQTRELFPCNIGRYLSFAGNNKHKSLSVFPATLETSPEAQRWFPLPGSRKKENLLFHGGWDVTDIDEKGRQVQFFRGYSKTNCHEKRLPTNNRIQVKFGKMKLIAHWSIIEVY